MASLIKTSGGKVPSRVIQFTNGDGDRKTIRLGKAGLAAAREFKNKVEALIVSVTTKTTLPLEVTTWVAGLPDDVHGKLAGVGLVERREPEPTSPTLDAWTTKYIGQRNSELKPSSVKKLKRTAELLAEHLKGTTLIDAIRLPDAAEWRAWLKVRGLAEATVRLHCRHAKTVFGTAAELEIID